MRTIWMVVTKSPLSCFLVYCLFEIPRNKTPVHRLHEALIIFISHQIILHTHSSISILTYHWGNYTTKMTV